MPSPTRNLVHFHPTGIGSAIPGHHTNRAGSETEQFIVPLCSVFRRHLKSANQKFTPERARVLDAIIRMDRVFEAEELLFELRERGLHVSKATVYRTLKLLIDAGIIEQVLYDNRQAHYRLAYGREPQGQLICVETGKIIDFSAPELLELRNRIARKHGWTPVGHQLQIYAVSTGPDRGQEAEN